jgi:hypothetical protein
VKVHVVSDVKVDGASALLAAKFVNFVMITSVKLIIKKLPVAAS